MLRPEPVPDDLTRPFWDGARRGRLVIQRCSACGHYEHPPYPECMACRASALEFVEVSGRGVVMSRVIVSEPIVPGFEDELPYACLLVELEEQAGLVVAGNLRDADPRSATVGAPVEAAFEHGPAFSLPMFRPRRGLA